MLPLLVPGAPGWLLTVCVAAGSGALLFLSLAGLLRALRVLLRMLTGTVGDLDDLRAAWRGLLRGCAVPREAPPPPARGMEGPQLGPTVPPGLPLAGSGSRARGPRAQRDARPRDPDAPADSKS